MLAQHAMYGEETNCKGESYTIIFISITLTVFTYIATINNS